MSNLLRDLILNSTDIDREQVEVPEWGCTIELRGFDGLSRASMIKRAGDASGHMDIAVFYPVILTISAYDPTTGARIFEEGDVAALQLKNAALVEKLAQKVLDISKLTKESQDALGKDSSTIPSDASTSS